MPDSVHNLMNSIGELTPFMTMVAGRPQINTSKIMETLIITALVAGVTRFIIVAEMKVELQNVKVQMVKMESDYKERFDNVMVEIKGIKGDFYVPKFKTKDEK